MASNANVPADVTKLVADQAVEAAAEATVAADIANLSADENAPAIVPSFSVSAVTASSVTVVWANVTPTSVGRNGTDANGTGPWAQNAPTGGTLTFASLLAGTPYVFTLIASGVTLTCSATTSAAPVTAKTEIGLFVNSESDADWEAAKAGLGLTKTAKRYLVYGDMSQGGLAWFQGNVPASDLLAIGFYGIGTTQLLSVATANAKAAVAAGFKGTLYRPDFEFDLAGANEGQGNQTLAVIQDGLTKVVSVIRAIDPTAIIAFNVSNATSASWSRFWLPSFASLFDSIAVDFYWEPGNTTNGNLADAAAFAKSVGKPLEITEFGVIDGSDGVAQAAYFTNTAAQIQSLGIVRTCIFAINPATQPLCAAAIAKAFG